MRYTAMIVVDYDAHNEQTADQMAHNMLHLIARDYQGVDLTGFVAEIDPMAANDD